MALFTDQTGRVVHAPEHPMRIVSLVPSQTELLFDLGLENEVIGITKFCVHPEQWFRTKTRVGGTKQVNIELIQKLQPDLIIANKEENVRDQVEELSKSFPVWVSDVDNIKEALGMIRDIGRLTGKESRASDLISAIQKNFESSSLYKNRHRAAYLIWKDPWMAAGGDTFINAMMEAAGLDNVFKELSRYPEVTIPELRDADCRFLLLSSEPFPFRQKHADELSQLLPGNKVLLVDGEMFSWYGSRMKYAPGYFRNLLAGI